MTEETYKKICSRFAKGVTIVTARRSSDGLPIGVTVSAFTGVSLQPPTILICLNHNSKATRILLEARYFAVNVLSDGQQELSQCFATRDIEKRFSGINWQEGLYAVPILPATLGTLVCELGKSIIDGDHHVIFGHVLEGSYREGSSPLIYWASAYQSLRIGTTERIAG